MKPLLVSESASLELVEAMRWIDERRPGWGARLFDAVTRVLDLIERHPEAGTPRRGVPGTRQLLVRGFPYVVTYQIRPADIYVVALAHTSRRPAYWQGRR